MFQDNPLLAQLKQQIRENIPKKGVIRASDRGFGFLEVDEDQLFRAASLHEEGDAR